MDGGIPMRMTPNYSASLYWMFCEIQYIRRSFPCNVSIPYLYNGGARVLIQGAFSSDIHCYLILRILHERYTPHRPTVTIPKRVPIRGADPQVSFSGQQSEKSPANPVKLFIVGRLRSGALQIPVVQESAIDRLAFYGID